MAFGISLPSISGIKKGIAYAKNQPNNHGILSDVGQFLTGASYGGNDAHSDHYAFSPQAPVQPAGDPQAGDPGTYDGSGSSYYSSGGSYAAPLDLSFLDDQEAQLRSLLGRTDTALNQGLTRNEDEYNRNVGSATTDKDNQVTSQNKAKLSAYDTINRNAGNGFRSLAQLIGRAAGTGSSAYQEMLPDVIGKDTSSKRMNATTTYGDNLTKIDTSFQSVLADLLRQKKENEDNLRTNIEGQRQDLNSKLGSVAGERAQALGGGYDAVKAASAPFNQAIENSRNAVENFFNTYRTPYTPQAINPDLNQYNIDRTSVNAANSGDGVDPNNPYASLLRKKLQQGI